MVRLRIRELAEQRGLNITELSRQARIGYSTAHALWHDKPENLNRTVLSKIARVLGVQVRELFAEDEDGPAEQPSPPAGKSDEAGS
jgi:DNA-binding Xre family transcriptional regulator